MMEKSLQPHEDGAVTLSQTMDAMEALLAKHARRDRRPARTGSPVWFLQFMTEISNRPPITTH